MKKRLVAGFVVGVVLAAALVLGLVAQRKSLGISTGRCLVADNGSYMLIVGNDPIVMRNVKGKETLFDGLDTGDLIRVLHDGIQESYPGGTGAYAVWKLEEGFPEDISEEVRKSLTGLGWYGSKIQVSDCELPQKGEEKVAEAGGMELCENAPVAFAAQYIRTDPYCEDNDYPSVVVIRSVEALQQYYEENKGMYDLERKEKVYADTTIGFLDACDGYDEAYFAKQSLVMVILEEGSGSIRHEVMAVESTEVNGQDGLVIKIESRVPEVCTDDMAEWHILIETEEGFIVPEPENMVLYLNDKNMQELCGYPLKGAGETEGAERVSAEHSGVSLSVDVPDGWIYEIVKPQENYTSFGIQLRPEGENEGWLQFFCHEVWGVCGTGLKQQEIVLGQYEASKGIYDGGKAWDFIVIKEDLDGKFVIQNYGATWLAAYMEEAMEMLQTIYIESK